MATILGLQLASVGEYSTNNYDGRANDMTNVTTDIEHWYEMNEPEDQDGKNDLVQSVETVASVGCYTTEKKNGQLFVSGWSGEQLRLAGDERKARFLRFVRDAEVPDDIDLDFERAMEDSKS